MLLAIFKVNAYRVNGCPQQANFSIYETEKKLYTKAFRTFGKENRSKQSFKRINLLVQEYLQLKSVSISLERKQYIQMKHKPKSKLKVLSAPYPGKVKSFNDRLTAKCLVYRDFSVIVSFPFNGGLR